MDNAIFIRFSHFSQEVSLWIVYFKQKALQKGAPMNSLPFATFAYCMLASPARAWRFNFFNITRQRKKSGNVRQRKMTEKKWRLIQTIWKIKDASKFILQLSCKPREFAAVSSQFLELLWNCKSHNQSKITAYNKVGHFLLQKYNQLIIKNHTWLRSTFCNSSFTKLVPTCINIKTCSNSDVHFMYFWNVQSI